MKQYFEALKDCTLFKGIAEDEFCSHLKEMNVAFKKYKKNEVIHEFGKEIRHIGVVVYGVVHVIKIDDNGNKNLILKLKVGEAFGEVVALGGMKNSPIGATAASSCEILLIPVKSLLDVLLNHNKNPRLTKNVILLITQKNVMLHIKNDILAHKTIREKLIAYFFYESNGYEKKNFSTHFTREEMADFLCVNANALSRELGKMQQEGLLSFKKNQFKIKASNLMPYDK